MDGSHPDFPPGTRLPAGVSYQSTPGTAYGLMARALAREVEVRSFATPAPGEPGYPGAGPLFPYLQSRGGEFRFFLFNDDTVYDEVPIMECPTAIWFGDYWPSDYFRRAKAPLFDHVFTAAPYGVGHFRALGCKSVHWLPFACDPDIHRDEGLERIYDIGFVGQLNQKGHERRRVVLKALSERYRMNDYTRPAYLRDMARIYAQSKIVVNFPKDGGLNMRVFEGMACGAMLLTEDVEGQSGLFEDGRHLVVYRGPEDLVRKVGHYMSRPAERQAIAAAGRSEVLLRHTYAIRARKIIETLDNAGGARNRSADPAVLARAFAIFYANRMRPDLLARQLARRGLPWRSRLYVAARLARSLYSCARAGRRA